jgi:hypothetical protein
VPKRLPRGGIDAVIKEEANCAGDERTGLSILTRAFEAPTAMSMRMSFWTLDTPGAAQAARSSSSRSAQVFTFPRRITLPALASTEIFSASVAIAILDGSKRAEASNSTVRETRGAIRSKIIPK